jgi:hypothetical protein
MAMLFTPLVIPTVVVNVMVYFEAIDITDFSTVTEGVVTVAAAGAAITSPRVKTSTRAVATRHIELNLVLIESLSPPKNGFNLMTKLSKLSHIAITSPKETCPALTRIKLMAAYGTG